MLPTAKILLHIWDGQEMKDLTRPPDWIGNTHTEKRPRDGHDVSPNRSTKRFKERRPDRHEIQETAPSGDSPTILAGPSSALLNTEERDWRSSICLAFGLPISSPDTLLDRLMNQLSSHMGEAAGSDAESAAQP